MSPVSHPSGVRDVATPMSRAFLDWARQVGLTGQVEPGSTPPLPPRSLRLITSHDVEERFLAMGLADTITCLQRVQRLARTGGRRLRVLDFGCGCGRLGRYLSMLETLDCCGVDVNPDLVRWCRENLPGIVAVQGQPEPPLELDDASFDFILAVSVFTHLSQIKARAWIRELARLIVPGGLLLLTTHGYSAAAITTTSPPHQALFGFDERAALESLDRLAEEHFVFHPYPEDLVRGVQVGGIYGNAFADPIWVRENWQLPELRLVEHAPGGMRGFQDVVLFQRR